ncbi:hypothetical protein [Hungatella effluvii]|uniref:hypothetical protein n=1 Tax=Hungatella effluvii TaxID=1096246 RepID=UPI001F5955FC|nr:hypothetical protein [Hungatella effluvii]
MSYELDYEKSYICPCGKGLIVEKSFSNEWNQVNKGIKLLCPWCEKEYHIQNISVIHGDHVDNNPVLVPKGESIYRNTSIASFPEALCCSYSLETLGHVFKILTESTTYPKITDYTTREVIRKCKSYHNTMRIKTVKEYVFDAINIYDEIANSYERENERINATEKKVIYIRNLKAAN